MNKSLVEINEGIKQAISRLCKVIRKQFFPISTELKEKLREIKGEEDVK